MKHRFFRYGAIMMILTAIIHLLAHFMPPQLQSPEEQELYRLMNTLSFELDPWFSRTVQNLFDVFSLSLSALLFPYGLINLILHRRIQDDGLIKTLSLINAGGMILCTILSFFYLFSVPIALFAGCSILFLIAWQKA